MLLGIPLALWLGMLTLILLVIAFSLGIAVMKFGKPVLKHHVRMAVIAMSLAVVHAIIAALLWFFGLAI